MHGCNYSAELCLHEQMQIIANAACRVGSQISYCILGIVHGRKVHEFHEPGSIRECFLALFISAGILSDCLNHESFPANYDKEGNLQSFSSADDSRYIVLLLYYSITFKILYSGMNNKKRLVEH